MILIYIQFWYNYLWNTKWWTKHRKHIYETHYTVWNHLQGSDTRIHTIYCINAFWVSWQSDIHPFIGIFKLLKLYNVVLCSFIIFNTILPYLSDTGFFHWSISWYAITFCGTQDTDWDCEVSVSDVIYTLYTCTNHADTCKQIHINNCSYTIYHYNSFRIIYSWNPLGLTFSYIYFYMFYSYMAVLILLKH